MANGSLVLPTWQLDTPLATCALAARDNQGTHLPPKWATAFLLYCRLCWGCSRKGLLHQTVGLEMNPAGHSCLLPWQNAEWRVASTGEAHPIEQGWWVLPLAYYFPFNEALRGVHILNGGLVTIP